MCERFISGFVYFVFRVFGLYFFVFGSGRVCRVVFCVVGIFGGFLVIRVFVWFWFFLCRFVWFLGG